MVLQAGEKQAGSSSSWTVRIAASIVFMQRRALHRRSGDVLSNPDKRARYDQFGHEGMSGAGGFGGGVDIPSDAGPDGPSGGDELDDPIEPPPPSRRKQAPPEE